MRRHSRSRMTRNGLLPETSRVVRRGLSAAAVRAPTITASHSARKRCRCRMFCGPVTKQESPDGVAMKPSRLCPRCPTVIGRSGVALTIGR